MPKNCRPTDDDVARIEELLDQADRSVLQAWACTVGSEERKAFLLVAEGKLTEASGLIRALGG